MRRAALPVALLLAGCGRPGPEGGGGETSTSTSTTSSEGTDSSGAVDEDSDGSGGSSDGGPADGAMEIPEEPWRIGDPDAGYDVLLYGDNTGAGIPTELFVELPGPPAENLLERDGPAADVPWFFNAYEVEGGVSVAAPNCLSCHGSRLGPLDDALVIGLGNVFEGGRLLGDSELSIVRLQVENAYGEDSPELAAFEPFFNGFSALIGHAEPPAAGANTAFFIEEAGIAHRDPDTFAWLEEPRFDKATTVLASDVPPLWHLSKKHALYYNGMGRGDAARLLMQSSVVATFGIDHLQGVDEAMPDLLAYLMSLKAPVFPGEVDEALVEQGETIFASDCAPCHGTYGDDESYPNLLVPLEDVGTDPAYAEHFMQPGRLADAYNEGWYATGDPASRLQPEAGYVAPPLDGIWATAPYFHNGSVPTLDAVLDSSARPEAWLRDFETRGYDLDVPGLSYELVEAGTPNAYDTGIAGSGNGGHTFGDALNADERAAVVEYLKTL